jgi:hypothetical protein
MNDDDLAEKFDEIDGLDIAMVKKRSLKSVK